MDSTAAEFLTTGTVHPTCRSHRAAAKSYHAFLVKEKKSRDQRSISSQGNKPGKYIRFFKKNDQKIPKIRHT